jgi:hypothetical protein
VRSRWPSAVFVSCAPNFTFTSRRSPSRNTVNVATSPGWCATIGGRTSSARCTGCPSIATIWSPSCSLPADGPLHMTSTISTGPGSLSTV